MDIVQDDLTKQVIEISLNGLEVFSIIASVFSIVLGIVAIWLSVLFYRMSDKSSKEIEKSSSAIDGNVKRLDVLFDKMYNDTFGMVKETVSDMRQYVYKSNSNDETITKNIESEIENKVKSIVNEAISDLHEDKISKTDLEALVNKIVKESTDVATNYKFGNAIDRVKYLLEINGPLTYIDLLRRFPLPDNSSLLFDTLGKMVELDMILDPFEIEPDNGKSIRHSKIIVLK